MKEQIPALTSNYRTPLTQEWHRNAAEMRIVKVWRSISSNGDTHKKVDELLAPYRPSKIKQISGGCG